jgi:hypothetical protein
MYAQSSVSPHEVVMMRMRTRRIVKTTSRIVEVVLVAAAAFVATRVPWMMLMQTPTSGSIPTVDIYKLAGLLVIAWGLMRFLFTPLFDNVMFRVFDRTTANKVRFRTLVQEAVSDELKAMTADITSADGKAVYATDVAEANRDHLKFVDESIKLQGAALTKDLATAIDRMTESMTDFRRDWKAGHDHTMLRLDEHGKAIERVTTQVKMIDPRARDRVD